MIPRRKLLAALVAGLALPRLALAQGPAMKQVIILHAGDAEDDEPAARPFFDELRKRGWAERVNIAYEHHSGRGMREYLETLAKTVAGKSPDLIYATTATTAIAAIKASEGVPVVFNSAADPVAAGLVQSLARPGRNATGTWQAPGNIMAGGYELLRQTMPNARRVGLVLDGRAADMQKQREANEAAALKQGFEVVPGEFTNFEAVAKIMAQFRRQNVHAARLTPSFTLLARRREVVMSAERNEVALLAHRSEWAEAGAMISYGADIADALRRSAAIADRILKGGKAAEIPVERSTGLELVINQRVANALGHTIPKQVLQRANRVIA
jgi:putative ABC transport system substrate-binding protein